MDRRAVQIGESVEVEPFQCFLVAEACTSQSHIQFLLLPSGDFVMNQQAEEIGVGQLAVDGFAVAGLE